MIKLIIKRFMFHANKNTNNGPAIVLVCYMLTRTWAHLYDGKSQIIKINKDCLR